MKKDAKTIIAAAVAGAGAVALILYYIFSPRISADDTADALWQGVIPRAALTATIFALLVLSGYTSALKVNKPAPRTAAWLLPCLAVAVANFPFSALAGGAARIDRADLLWLFLLKCLLIALCEEALFRGMLLGALRDVLKDSKHGFILSVLLSSAAFGLFHLLNLLEGAGIGPTLLQAGYTTLTGAMFACVTLKTGNIWSAAALHFIFDIGGLIVPDIGSGPFQDGVFWALTAVCAAVCAAHLMAYAVRADRAGPAKDRGKAGRD